MRTINRIKDNGILKPTPKEIELVIEYGAHLCAHAQATDEMQFGEQALQYAYELRVNAGTSKASAPEGQAGSAAAGSAARGSERGDHTGGDEPRGDSERRHQQRRRRGGGDDSGGTYADRVRAMDNVQWNFPDRF